MEDILKNTWVVVPVGSRHKYLEQLVNILDQYKGRIVFVNNHHPYPVFEGVHHLEDFQKINIHRWWNRGIEFSKSNGAKYVAVINDDVFFDQSLIFNMITAMKNGSYEVCSALGNVGAFWIISADSKIRADENLRWWCGDGDIFRQADVNYKFLNYKNHQIKHLEHNLQTTKDPELLKIGKEDLIRYYNKLKKINQLEYWKK
jgi:hypothetical protein